jgi:chemotaxis methyl-accepting protein methylase
MVRPITVDDFEDLFRTDPDPWKYETSQFEYWKRAVLLYHVGLRTYGRVLEPACANGVTTRLLLDRSLRIIATDASQTALAQAETRLRGKERAIFLRSQLPLGLPNQRFDLIVISEIVYYLDRNAARILARRTLSRLSPGGRVVVLHHHIRFMDASVPPEAAHLNFVRLLLSKLKRVRSTRTGRFRVDTFVAGRRH